MADLASKNTDSVTKAFQAGMVSQRTALKELRQQAEMTGMWSNITDEDIENADNTVQNPNEGDIFGGGMEEETEPAAINDAMPLVDVLDWNEKEHPRRSNGQFSTNKDKNANITSSARGINKFANHGFINKNKELAHKKHLSEFPDMTMQDYINRGIELLQSPVGGDILGYKNKNQIITRYNKRTNEFAKGRPDRGIYTLYKPVDGVKYYENMRKGDLEHGGED